MRQINLPARAKSAAPGQYLGFSLQQLRTCHYLLTAPDGASVSLEYLDDVGVHTDAGKLLLEQCKSALNGNPIADNAEQLWKTFANWAELCKSGRIEPKLTNFRLYITPTNKGDIATALDQASSIATIRVALQRVKELCKVGKPGTASKSQITRFLAAGDDICQAVIANFKLIIEDNPLESVRVCLRLLPPETLDDFCSAAIGMARDRFDSLIRRKKPSVVDVTNFRKSVFTFVKRNNLSNLLISKTPKPSANQVSFFVNTAPTFVRQLQAVKASDELISTAVSDYLRTSADKITWADEGVVVAGSLDELDALLERTHKLVRDEMEDTLSSKKEDFRGRAVYRKCTQTSIPLDGRSVPSHFVPGAFNCLADTSKIGWHPNFKKLFPPD